MLFSHHTAHPMYQTSLTFSTSVGLAIVEDITPDTTPQIILIRRVSSVKRRGEKERKNEMSACIRYQFLRTEH